MLTSKWLGVIAAIGAGAISAAAAVNWQTLVSAPTAGWVIAGLSIASAAIHIINGQSSTTPSSPATPTASK